MRWKQIFLLSENACYYLHQSLQGNSRRSIHVHVISFKPNPLNVYITCCFSWICSFPPLKLKSNLDQIKYLTLYFRQYSSVYDVVHVVCMYVCMYVSVIGLMVSTPYLSISWSFFLSKYKM